MADEVKETKEAEGKEAPKKAEEAHKKTEEAPAKESSSRKQEAAPKKAGKKKKINALALDEVEEELKIVKEKMGGFSSRYAQHLLLRKKELTAS